MRIRSSPSCNHPPSKCRCQWQLGRSSPLTPGFQGARLRTIAIDLTDVFLCDDHRIRLVSNMELCWDVVFYTRGERTTSYGFICCYSSRIARQQTLHYRGFSELIPNRATLPRDRIQQRDQGADLAADDGLLPSTETLPNSSQKQTIYRS